MKDRRITQMKFRAERDLKISHAARCLVMRACSHVYVNPHRMADAPFAMTWRHVKEWVGVGTIQAYRLVEEVVKSGYLKREGIVGSPPMSTFSLRLNYIKNGIIDYVKKDAIDYVKKEGLHISNPYGKKMKKKSGEVNGSLRSQKRDDDKTAPSAEKRDRQDGSADNRTLVNQSGKQDGDAFEKKGRTLTDAMRKAAGLG